MYTTLPKIVIILMLAIGCAQNRPPENQSGNARRALDEFYHASGIIKYFLPDLPVWANGSLSGGCHRHESIRYFHLKEISSTYNLELLDILQAQISFNSEMENILSIARLDPNLDKNVPVILPPRQEEVLFYQTLDKVQAKFYSFMVPTFKRVNLLWIDQLLTKTVDDKNVESFQLKKEVVQKILNHPWASTGHPVLISFCLTSKELEKMMSASNSADQNIRLLGSEAMTPFLPDFSLTSFPIVPLSVIFAKGQDLHLYSPDNKKPPEINGAVTLHAF